jgi:hypothetical protein
MYKELYYNWIKDILKYWKFMHVLFIEGERYVGKMLYYEMRSWEWNRKLYN